MVADQFYVFGLVLSHCSTIVLSPQPVITLFVTFDLALIRDVDLKWTNFKHALKSSHICRVFNRRLACGCLATPIGLGVPGGNIYPPAPRVRLGTPAPRRLVQEIGQISQGRESKNLPGQGASLVSRLASHGDVPSAFVFHCAAGGIERSKLWS